VSTHKKFKSDQVYSIYKFETQGLLCICQQQTISC